MPEALMTSVEAIRAYLFGCSRTVVFTLVSKKTGNRHTYRLRRVHSKRNFFFVDTLTGEDNEADYGFIGTVYRDAVGHWAFAYSRKSAVLPSEAPSVLGIDFFIARINRDIDLNVGKIEFWHSGKCSRCGRTLTVPASLEIGMGPKCAEKAREAIR